MGSKAYWSAFFLLFIAIGYLIISDNSQAWDKFNSIGVKYTVILLSFAFLLNSALILYAYWYPRAALVRANVSMYFSCALALTGTPLAFSISILSKMEIIPVSVEFTMNDAGWSGSVSTIIAIFSLMYFFSRYVYLSRPENINWSTKTPVIS